MNPSKRKELILITGGFPFGNGETFLETEIKYLCSGFEKVRILAVDPNSSVQRVVPANCSVTILNTERGLLQKFKALFGFFDSRITKEIRIIRKIYGLKLNKGIVSTMLVSMNRAKVIKRELDSGIKNDVETVCYSYWCDDSALALALLSEERKQLKTICRIHRWDVYFDQSAIGYLPFRHYIHDHVSAIYSISEDGIQYAKSVWKVSGEKLKLSRLGIEAQEPSKQRKDSIFTLVSCSNLIPVKRVHLIAEAVKKLDGEIPLRWVHIGDGPERTMIEQILSDLSDQTEVRLVGRLANSEVFSLYKELSPDVFINVSSSEGVPVSIMEAMSFGIPVIATDVGGNREIVNEENGILIPEEIEFDVLADHISTLYQKNQTSINDQREKALSTWEKDYNAEINYYKFTDQICAS